MESFWHSLKVEETHGRGFATRDEAKRCVFAYIEGFYNTRRMHSSIGWQSLRAFRAAFERERRQTETNPGKSPPESEFIERNQTGVTGAANEQDFSGDLCTGRVELAGPSSDVGAHGVQVFGEVIPDKQNHRRNQKNNSVATPLKSWGLITQ
jgi:Integrase core domain